MVKRLDMDMTTLDFSREAVFSCLRFNRNIFPLWACGFSNPAANPLPHIGIKYIILTFYMSTYKLSASLEEHEDDVSVNETNSN